MLVIVNHLFVNHFLFHHLSLFLNIIICFHNGWLWLNLIRLLNRNRLICLFRLLFRLLKRLLLWFFRLSCALLLYTFTQVALNGVEVLFISISRTFLPIGVIPECVDLLLLAIVFPIQLEYTLIMFHETLFLFPVNAMVINHTFNLTELIQNVKVLLITSLVPCFLTKLWKYVFDESSFIFTEIEVPISILSNERSVDIEFIIILESDLLNIEIESFDAKYELVDIPL